MISPEQARLAARWIAENLPGPGPVQQAALAAKDHLLETAAAADSGRAVWVHNAWTGTLVAADPGAVHCPRMVRVPDFAMHVPTLVELPGWPMLLWGEGSRQAAHSARSRLVDRLEQVGQGVLADAVRDVVLEQDAQGVLARYEPQGQPLRIAD